MKSCGYMGNCLADQVNACFAATVYFLPMRVPRWMQGSVLAAIACKTPTCAGGKGGQQSDLITARIWQLPVN
tara:strand:+ start:1142 stop:1357 length:216 start_codon:yes stop_codon:yes gene_type:complete